MATHRNNTPTMMRVLAAAVRANVPALLWGDPGVGKTAKLEAYGAAWGREVCTISASSRAAVDFMGLPMERDERVVYSPLSWAIDLNAATQGLLVVDEVTTAADTFKAFLRIVQERYVGEYKLNDTVSIVAIANPADIAVDGVDLPAPVANRFMHLDWYFDIDQWLENVGTEFAFDVVPDPSTYLGSGSPERRAEVNQQILGFLKAQPNLVNKVPRNDLDAQGKAWPSARSWTNVMAVLAQLPADDDDARDMTIKSLVGEGACIAFLSWLAQADLVDPAAVIADPTLLDYTGRLDKVFATLSAVTDLALIRGDYDTWKGALTVMVSASRASRADLAIPGATRLLNVAEHVAVGGLPDGVEEAFTSILVRMGLLAPAAVAA